MATNWTTSTTIKRSPAAAAAGGAGAGAAPAAASGGGAGRAVAPAAGGGAGGAAAPAAAGGAGGKTSVAVGADGLIIESDADKLVEHTSFDTMGLHEDLLVCVATRPRGMAGDRMAPLHPQLFLTNPYNHSAARHLWVRF